MKIPLSVTQCDYLTLTSREERFIEFWHRQAQEHARFAGTELKTKNVMQYQGVLAKTPSGTIFAGSGYQSHSLHHLVRVSGELANMLLKYAASQFRQGYVNCKRIDLQVTIEEPDKWSQWHFFNRIKKAGRLTPGWVESKAGRIGNAETVYVGSRNSQRMTRVYVKGSSEGTRLLRLETEYKGQRANFVMRGVCDGEVLGGYLAYELMEVIRDNKLRRVFEPHIEFGNPVGKMAHVETPMEKTEQWLIKQVLPSFIRHINDHSNSGMVLDLYSQAITEAVDRYAS